MRAFLTRALIVAGGLLIAATVSAQGLGRVGPTSPSTGYPTWYQDKTGITLEFCQPQVQAELDGGWCLILPPSITTVPEILPTNFSPEHFYWAGGATLPNLTATLTLSLEGAFANGAVINGDQIVFARIRIVFTASAAGQYTVQHPFGTDVFTATAGQKVRFTEDVGLACAPGTFDCALAGRLGPFLLPSAVAGGAELPAIPGPAPGKLYIADPARLGPVTGSPVGQNFFRITGPGGIDQRTDNFTLTGRLFTGAMGGRVSVDRASYARDAGQANGKVDVFATAFASSQPRLPGGQLPVSVTPALGFYPAACSVGANGAPGAPGGVAAVQMFSAETRYYGQSVGAIPIPAAVCVADFTARDPNGQIVPTFTQRAVTDQVTITQASYNPAAGGTLTVAATSSDADIPPQLSVAGLGSFTSGTTLTATVGVPASRIFVTSAAGGSAETEVTTLAGQPDFPAVPVAGSDTFTMNEDSGTNVLNVLANDTYAGTLINPAQATIAIVQQPALGIAQVGVDPVDGITPVINFTPAPNVFGNDLLQYTVTVNGITSQAGFVAITINNVNDPPVAVNDTANGVGGLGISVNLLANDTDPDGQADLKDAVIGTPPAGSQCPVAVGTILPAGTLNFTAAAGSYACTYQARDVALAVSNVATVTVTLSAGDILGITRSDYIANKRRWRVDGTSTVSGGQTVFITYADGTFADGTSAAGTLIGTAQVAAGLFTLDLTLAAANDLRNPANSTLFKAGLQPRNIRVTSSLGGSATRAIAFR
jgi:Bacterial cadherin-like domain